MSLVDSITSIFSKVKGTQSVTAAVVVDKSVLFEKIRQSELFKDLPEDNLEEMFRNMETMNVKSGFKIINEGAEGDYYYLLVCGTAKVTRRTVSGGSEELATLSEPTGFGEEALISNAKRNATITMATPGTVMRLSKDGFNDYVKEPIVQWFSPMEAQTKIAEGARWVDVRDVTQSEHDHLHGSISIPMNDLRTQLLELDKATLYVCYCENGRLSSTAAFLMRQAGLNAGVLRGGLNSLKKAGIA